MNSFENNFNKEKPGDRVIRDIFRTEGRTGFRKKVEEMLKWSERGGPRIGTSSFMKGVAGKDNLEPEKYSILRRETSKEVKNIRKNRSDSNKKDVDSDDYKKIVPEAENNLKEELKRSGGIDPNEI